MPPRQFDGKRLRAVRRTMDIKAEELGAAVGVTGAAVARWESGRDFPKAERFPAIAAALRQSLDGLFPHDGPADLQLLRCDAGLSMAQAAEVIGTSRVPLRNAEMGKRRLQDAFVRPLADAYGVTQEELLAAQDRSFGVGSPRPPAPRLVGEKIDYLLEHWPAGQDPPSNEEIARAVSAHAGTATTAADVEALRRGDVTDPSEEIRAGLAHALQVDEAVFADDTEVNLETQEFMEALRFLGSIQEGKILGLAARGNERGLPSEMIRTINQLVGELKHKLPPDTPNA